MGKNVQDYIERLEYVKGLGNIMTVEHRSNNPKRDYLFCNKIQGKHIPVSPSLAFDIFDELAYIVDKKLKDKRVVVVGFAETATAIGGYMASHVESCVYHLQTSRENCSPSGRLIEFSEEHSHATEQYLYGELDAMPKFDYILFVEDEISTQLKKIGVYKSNRDGGESMTWRVADYGSFLVHIMTQEARDFYLLDKMFSFGKEINFKKPKTVKKPAAKKTATKKTAKKTTTKKTVVKKTTTKKVAAKKPTAKKTVVKKAVKTTKKTTKKAAK